MEGIIHPSSHDCNTLIISPDLDWTSQCNSLAPGDVELPSLSLLRVPGQTLPDLVQVRPEETLQVSGAFCPSLDQVLQVLFRLVHSHWSRNVEARLSMVESFLSDACANSLMT